MEAEEIYMNREVKMQAAAFKEKRGAPANKGAGDPNYENIVLNFRNRDQPKSAHSSPKNQVPSRSRPLSKSSQVPHWLHTALLSLYILLTLVCIILLALILVKNLETSQELLHLKRELSNVSLLVQQCQEEQKLSREDILKNIIAVKKNISMVQDKVQHMNDNLKDLSKAVSNITTNVKKIFGELEKQANKPTP
uniref:Mast cell expressed membrane protein 1 n=1 Tax=Equus asinus TaxID=9793 RepID=A0A9L0JE66_EQUAS|nr:mast cell-expressed membrane protein 1 isoform X1 [Equus asinus]